MFKNHPHRSFILWLLSGCFLIYVMVVVGCITRLTHSGLSITDWSVMGSIPPLSEESWQKHFDGYKQSPEYQIINSGMSLEEFKSIFWWEYIHRFIGRFIGFVFIAGFFIFFIRKKFPAGYLKKTILLCLLGALQGLIGWWMVKSGLVNNPYVSHFRLAIHLMSAFTVFAFTFWFSLQLIFQNREDVYLPLENTNGLRRTILFVFIMLIIQIIYGAFVAGLKAGLYYPTWPKMGDDWFPSETILTSNSLLKDFTENGAGVQWVHRTFAWVVVLGVIYLWIKINKVKATPIQANSFTWLLYLLTAQIMLGIFTLLFSVPVFLGVMHQTVAFLLFANMIFLLFVFRQRKSA